MRGNEGKEDQLNFSSLGYTPWLGVTRINSGRPSFPEPRPRPVCFFFTFFHDPDVLHYTDRRITLAPRTCRDPLPTGRLISDRLFSSLATLHLHVPSSDGPVHPRRRRRRADLCSRGHYAG